MDNEVVVKLVEGKGIANIFSPAEAIEDVDEALALSGYEATEFVPVTTQAPGGVAYIFDSWKAEGIIE